MNTQRDEMEAIDALKAIADKWPKSLWLYSASGTLWVMKKKRDGTRAMTHGRGSGFDQKYALDCIPIENDGGDW
jgi:hypothetical protein